MMCQHLLHGNRWAQKWPALSACPSKETQSCCTWQQWLWLAVGWGRCSLLEGEVQFCLQEVAFPLSASSILLGSPEAWRQINHIAMMGHSPPAFIPVLNYLGSLLYHLAELLSSWTIKQEKGKSQKQQVLSSIGFWGHGYAMLRLFDIYYMNE